VTHVRTFACRHFDGVSSRPHVAVLRISSDGLTLESGDEVRDIAIASLRMAERSGVGTATVYLPDDTFLEVEDGAGLQATLANSGFREPLLERMQRRWLVAATAVTCCALLLTACYLHVLPWGARHAARLVPPAVAESMSAQVMEFLDGRLLAPTQLPDRETRRLRNRLARMRLPAEVPVGHRIEFRAAPGIGPNALALPSGTIVVTDELVEIAGSEEEVLAVLAHELGHVSERHGIRQALQGSVVALVLTWFLGDVSSIAAAIPAAVLQARYSRDMEREADDFAARMLSQNGLSPALLAGMLDRLERARLGSADKGDEPEGLSRYLATHPRTEERMRSLRQATPPVAH
jgi:Zn-dependent protease with chaperone function